MSNKAGSTTSTLYRTVIDEVIAEMQDVFLDEGIDVQVLQELKEVWKSKVLATKAVDSLGDGATATKLSTASSGARGRPKKLASREQNDKAAGDGTTKGEEIVQVDGPTGVTDDEEDFDEDEPDEATGEIDAIHGDPLNSDDDVSDGDEDVGEMFEVENTVACQYEKISRSRNKWKFCLKDGIMHLDGKDYVFNRGIGEGEF